MSSASSALLAVNSSFEYYNVLILRLWTIISIPLFFRFVFHFAEMHIKIQRCVATALRLCIRIRLIISMSFTPEWSGTDVAPTTSGCNSLFGNVNRFWNYWMESLGNAGSVLNLCVWGFNNWLGPSDKILEIQTVYSQARYQENASKEDEIAEIPVRVV